MNEDIQRQTIVRIETTPHKDYIPIKNSVIDRSVITLLMVLRFKRMKDTDYIQYPEIPKDSLIYIGVSGVAIVSQLDVKFELRYIPYTITTIHKLWIGDGDIILLLKQIKALDEMIQKSEFGRWIKEKPSMPMDEEEFEIYSHIFREILINLELELR